MSPSSVSSIVEIAESVVRATAFVVAGIWTYMLFVRKRQKYPRAAVTHFITHRHLSEARLLLHVAIHVRNVGDVLLEVESGFVRVHRVLPLESSTAEQIEIHERVTSNHEVDWPLVAQRNIDWREHLREIEPGEEDTFHFDFVSAPDVRTVQVYSYLRNVIKRRREVGWNSTTFYDIEPD